MKEIIVWILRSGSSSGGSWENVLTIYQYALDAAATLVLSKVFRNEALTLVAATLCTVFDDVESAPASLRMGCAMTLIYCLQVLGSAHGVSKIVALLLNDAKDEEAPLLGRQL